MSELQITIDKNDGQPPYVIPVQPGATTLHGTCGVGKSVLLAQIAAALGNPDRDVVKATAGDKGTTIDVCGVVLNATPKRASGGIPGPDDDVSSLEEFSVESLIYPPVKDSDAKNEHAIRCLLRIAKAQADVSLFHYLAGDKAAFDALVKPDAQRGKDLVEMAARVKKAFHDRKREAIAEAEKEEAAALADRDAVKDIPETEQKRFAGESPKATQNIHTAAVQRYARLQEQQDAYDAAQMAADDAREKLAEATGSGKTVAQFEEEFSIARDTRQAAQDKVAKIEAELREAKGELSTALSIEGMAISAVEDAKRFATATAGWQKAIDADAGGKPPDLMERMRAKNAVASAQEAIERGAVVRAAIARKENSKVHQKAADEARKRAHKLNLMADGTDAVLSKAVNSPRFSIQGGIIMGKLENETKPYFALSDGQRTILAVQEKIDLLEKADPSDRTKILDLGQRSAQDLPPSIREQVYQLAYNHKVCVIDAIVTDDPVLTYKVWSPKS